jgi:hypothetical protein
MIPQQHQRQSDFTDAAQYVKVIKIIYFALLLGQVIFMIFSVVQGMDKEANDKLHIIAYVVPILALTSIGGATVLFQLACSKARQAASLKEKLVAYQAACLVRWAAFEGVALFALCGYFVAHQTIFIIYAVVILTAFLTLQPGKKAIIRHLQLAGDEAETIMTGGPV